MFVTHKIKWLCCNISPANSTCTISIIDNGCVVKWLNCRTWIKVTTVVPNFNSLLQWRTDLMQNVTHMGISHNEMQSNTIRHYSPVWGGGESKRPVRSPKGIKLRAALEKAKFLIICHPGGGPCVMVCSRPGRRQSAARAAVTQSLLTTFPMSLFVYVVSLLTGLF